MHSIYVCSSLFGKLRILRPGSFLREYLAHMFVMRIPLHVVGGAGVTPSASYPHHQTASSPETRDGPQMPQVLYWAIHIIREAAWKLLERFPSGSTYAPRGTCCVI